MDQAKSTELYSEIPFDYGEGSGEPDPTARKYIALVEADQVRLEALIDGMPTRVRESARTCWHRDACPIHGGIVDHASRYWGWIQPEPVVKRSHPYALEKELNAVIASAMDLKGKLERLSADCREEIGATLQLRANAREWASEAWKLTTWIKFSPWHIFPDGWDSDQESACEISGQVYGQNIIQLEILARSLEPIVKELASRKQAPNGERMWWLADSVQFLVQLVFYSLEENGCPKSHVLPIARIIHEWATGEKPGLTWGERRFKRIRAMQKARGCTPARD